MTSETKQSGRKFQCPTPQPTPGNPLLSILAHSKA